MGAGFALYGPSVGGGQEVTLSRIVAESAYEYQFTFLPIGPLTLTTTTTAPDEIGYAQLAQEYDEKQARSIARRRPSEHSP